MSETDAPRLTWQGSIHEGIPVATEKLDACIDFYTKVLDLKLLPRPKALDDLGPGAWLGDDRDNVQFHLIANDVALKPAEDANVEPAGRHTAWRIGDVDAFRGRMRALGIRFRGDLEPARRAPALRHRSAGPYLGVPGSARLPVNRRDPAHP